MRQLLSVLLISVAWGCTGPPPPRIALPAPLTLTYGGTAVPAEGFGAGFELGDGPAGQERTRIELTGWRVGMGGFDRVSVWYGAYSSHQYTEEWGHFGRATVRMGRPLGQRTSTALTFGLAEDSRDFTNIQNDHLHVWDLALPSELVLTRERDGGKFSVYGGPRVVVSQLTDIMDTLSSHATYFGVLAGVHLSGGPFHLFAEATLTYIPPTTFKGQAYGGYYTVFPSVGAVLYYGRDRTWEDRRR